MNTPTICQELYNQDRFDNDDWPPTGLSGFIAWFQAKLDSVPAEYRHSVQVDFGDRGYSGDDGVRYIWITYTRLATPEEVAAEARFSERQREYTESFERVELARLLAKYGAPT